MKEDITLNNFFIFNSSYGLIEGEEHKKILYYYPTTHDIDIQIKNIGLVEAIIQFTGTFKPSSPVNSLHTQKKRQLYFQPEENFWTVMTLNVPYVEKTKDDVSSREYVDDIQDNVYEAVLKQIYAMYKLFNATFMYMLKEYDMTALKSKLEQFYDGYLKSLKLPHCDVLNVFNGIQFLPLDKQNFLSVQCFINDLECNYPFIEYTLFMYNDYVIWSGLKPTELQVLYQYLVNIFLPAHMETELQGGSMPRNPSSPFTAIHHGRFINGPANLKTAQNVGKLPKIFLFDYEEQTTYHMLVYRTLSASVCLFVKDTYEIAVQTFKDLDDFIGPKLSSIVSDVGEYCSQQIIAPSNISEHTPRFIYVNKMNLAYKSTMHLDNKQSGNLACPKDSVKIIADMSNRKSLLGYAGDIIVKTMNDYWVVGKISNMREFYVAIQQKNASLIDINDEVKRLCDNELKGIFFHSM